MSAEYANHWTFAASREKAEADPCFDEDLAEAAIRLLAGGDVGFKLSTRVEASELPKPKQRVFAVLRRLPERWFVPPALARQEGFYDDWRKAVGDCESPDDQLLAMPRNRRYGGGWSMAVECRPLDETDRRRYLTLQSVFGDYSSPPDVLAALPAIEGRLSRAEDRLTALEAKGIECAPGRAV